MTEEEAVICVAVAVGISQELNEDYVEMWKIARHIRDEIQDVSSEAMQTMARVILRGLLGEVESTVVFGSIGGEGFAQWPEGDGVDRAMREWATLGRDPDMGDIGWLSREPSPTDD